MPFVYAVAVFIFISIIPVSAFAWGPGFHVDVAMSCMARLGSIAPIIADLIGRFPNPFIYGSASPDIIVGKKYAGYLHHCHSWRMGHLILSEASSDRQRAAAYGYLVHLAADVVAHNYYIPFKMIRSYSSRLLTHTYWEMRFDIGVSDKAWDSLKMITKIEIDEFDNLLEKVLRKTLFSFSTNKRIFNSILILQRMRSLRKSLKAYARISRFEMVHENREHYRKLALDAAFDFLVHPDDSWVLEMDPTGVARLEYAKNLRRRIRRMLERGVMDESQAEKVVELVKEKLALALFRSDMQLPDIVDVL